jgi:N utilization substance protein A
VEAAGESMMKLKENEAYQEMAEREAEAMEKVAAMLEKKAEGRPLPPEDYDFMGSFVDRVERRVEKKRREEDLEEKRRYEEARATVPDLTFEIDILDVDLKEHLLYILQEAGIESLGGLVLQMRLDPDKVLGLNGIGPKSFEEIKELTDGLRVTPEEMAAAAAAEAEAALETEPVEEAVEAEAVAEAEAEVEEAEVEAVEEQIAEAEAVEEAVEVAEPEAEPEEEKAPAKPAPAKAKPEVKAEEKEEEEEESEFDKLFSYDARKFGYYKDERPKPEVLDEDESQKSTKKKKRKKRRPNYDEQDEWEEW